MSDRAKQVLAELTETWPWFLEADGVVVDILCRAKARHDMLADWVDSVIAGTKEAHATRGRPRTGVEAVPERVWLALHRTEHQVVEAARSLGLTPSDRAALLKDAGMAHLAASQLQDADIERLVARGEERVARLQERRT